MLQADDVAGLVDVDVPPAREQGAAQHLVRGPRLVVELVADRGGQNLGQDLVVGDS